MKRVLKLALFTIALLAIGGVFGYNVGFTKGRSEPDTVAQTVQAEPKPPTVDELLRLVNEERAKVGVAPLHLYDGLMATAQERADDMVKRNYFSHFDPVDGRKLINEQDPNCTGMSENIFWSREPSHKQTAVEWWHDSPPHYKAMVNPDYKSIGFGIKDWRVVAHFCIDK